jgi:hypothetical protein
MKLCGNGQALMFQLHRISLMWGHCQVCLSTFGIVVTAVVDRVRIAATHPAQTTPTAAYAQRYPPLSKKWLAGFHQVLQDSNLP